MRQNRHENLVDLSLNAAIELDEMIEGIGGDEKIVLDFIDLLEGGNGNANGSPQGLLRDLRNLPIYNNAWHTVTGSNAVTTDELFEDVTKHLEKFRSNKKGSGVELLTQLRNFCLALNKEFVSNNIIQSQKSRNHSSRSVEARVVY